MMRGFVFLACTFITAAAFAQPAPQPKRRHTQKEVRAQMKEDERNRASGIRKKFDDYAKTASSKSENRERRRSAMEALGHSQDVRAAKLLLQLVDDPDARVASGALIGVQTLTRSVDDDPQMLKDVKAIVAAKMLSVAKGEPSDLNRATVLVGILNNIGEDAAAAELGKKLVEKGRAGVLHEFCYWDESVEPMVFKIRPVAKQLFDAAGKDKSEETRVSAAALLAKAGSRADAFPVLVEVLKSGHDLIQRQRAMDELRSIGDEPSRKAVQEVMDPPELVRSAGYVLRTWDKRPKK